MHDSITLFLQLPFLVRDVFKVILPHFPVHNKVLAVKVQRFVLLWLKRNTHIIAGDVGLRLLEIALVVD